MSINIKKSSCFRIGHRYNVIYASVMASPYNWRRSLDIWVYSLFHCDLSNVYLCMLNVLSMLCLMVYLESSWT